MANPQSILFDRLDRGLNTKVQPSELAPGFAQAGSKNFLPKDKVLASAPGYARLTTVLPDDFTYKLNGQDQFMRGSIDGTGSLVSAAHAALTVKLNFRIDAIPQDLNPAGGGFYWAIMAHRGSGIDKDGTFSISNTRYAIGISVNTSATVKTMRVLFVGSDGAAIWSRQHTTSLELNTWYTAAATFSVANNWTYYVGEVGDTLTADAPGGAHSTTPYADFDGGFLSFYGVPVAESTFSKWEEQSQYNFAGVVQDFQVWDDELTQSEIEAIDGAQFEDPSSQADLIALYNLTGAGSNVYWLAPTKGTAGGGSGEAPYVALLPREATWRVSGHILGNPMAGTASLDFDGIAQGLIVPEPYRYRKQQPNDDTEYPHATYFAFSRKVKLRTLEDRATLFYSSHCPFDAPWEDVTGEVLTISGFNVSDTLLRPRVRPGSVVVTVTKSAGGDVTLVDNGTTGALAISVGTGTVSTGTVNYETGAITVDLIEDLASGVVSYQSYNSHLLQETTNTGSFATRDVGNMLLETIDTGAGAFRFRAVVFHEQFVEAEALTIVANDVADTLTLPYAVPGTVRVTVTKSAGGDVVLNDDGAGNFTIVSGTGTITSSSINYYTGAIAINLVQNLASGTVDYQSRRATSCISANNLVVDTLYTVTIYADSDDTDTGIILRLVVDSAATVSQTATASQTIQNSPQFVYPTDPGPSKKYLMTIGRAIDRCTQIHTLPELPTDIDVDYAFSRSEDGEIQRTIIVASEQDFDVRMLHDFAVNNTGSRSNASASLGMPITSHWPMQEGAGTTLEDVGLLANPIIFQEDSGHVWGKSGITTNNQQPVLGVFDHRYRSGTGEVRKIIAVAGGSVYEVDTTDGSLDWIGDGFRNDSGNVVATEKYIDSTILCADGRLSGPFQMWKGQLYRLSIDKPKGTIPFGLTKQGGQAGALKWSPEPYRYAFTFFSRHQNKRSEVRFGPEVTVFQRRADVAFGTAAEINQTYPTSGASVNPDPFDCSAEFTKIGASAWYGRTTTLEADDPDWYGTQPGTSGALTNEAPLKVINFEKLSIIPENDEVTAEQVEKAFEVKQKRCFVRIKGDDRIEILGGFPGKLGRLWLEDQTSNVATVSAGGVFDFGAESTGTVYTGTGVSDHGLALPFSTDPQVTHLEIWRTTAGGNQWFLVDRVENGTKTFIDAVRDKDLGGRELLDINRGPAPQCKFVREFAGRYFMWGDDLAPQRLYESALSEPWNFPPQNTNDVLRGTTQKIIACESTENAMVVWKNDATHVVTETGDSRFPFRMSLRFADVGCVSPRGVALRRGSFAFPNEQGIFGYDLNTLTDPPISDPISPTWLAVDPAHYEKIVAVRDWQNESSIWFYASGDQTVNGAVVNDRAFVLMDGGAWSLLDGIFVKHAVVIPNGQETNEVWLIDHHGYLSIYNQGTNYGVGTKTSRTPATAAGTFSTTQVTVAQATLANLPEGYRGFPVTVVDASDPTGQTRATRLCVADTLASPSVLTLSSALPFTPVQADTVLIGSIEMDWIGGEHGLPDREKQSTIVGGYFQGVPQVTSANFEIGVRSAGGIPPGAMVESLMTMSNQRKERRYGAEETSSRTMTGRHHRPRFRALGPDKPVEARSLTLFLTPSQGQGSARDDE